MNNQVKPRRWEYRSQLLATTSALVLMGSLCGADRAKAASDADRPPLWIEMGWQFEQVRGLGDLFHPPFFDLIPQGGLKSPLPLQRRIGFSYGGEGQISFQPDGSDWVFSAALRYGRAHGRGHTHQQFATIPTWVHRTANATSFIQRYSDARASNSETHAIIDFQAGKDVGMGLFGRGGSGVASVGIRFAQLNSKSTANNLTDPDFEFYKGKYNPGSHQYFPVFRYHAFAGSQQAARSFRGIGPEISWKAASPLLGEGDDGQLALDWGFNAALLFGRQTAKTQHQTTGNSFRMKYQISHGLGFHLQQDYQNIPPPADRRKSVLVPNLGGFAGLSVKWPNAKISVGYRGDFFFGAIDGGLDTRKSTTRGFYGPFASISVGVGD